MPHNLTYFILFFSMDCDNGIEYYVKQGLYVRTVFILSAALIFLCGLNQVCLGASLQAITCFCMVCMSVLFYSIAPGFILFYPILYA
jgi:hypothetical protein